jgi:hypothetical protein
MLRNFSLGRKEMLTSFVLSVLATGSLAWGAQILCHALASHEAKDVAGAVFVLAMGLVTTFWAGIRYLVHELKNK